MNKLALRMACAVLLFAFSGAVFAAERTTNVPALVTFVIFVLITLGISYWAGKYTTSNSNFYNAGGRITAAQNGTAIAGDFMSAASFLGITGIIYLAGFDGMLLALGALAGWPIMLFLMSERVRNLGRFTFTDVVSYRLQKKPIRFIASLGSISIIVFYLIAQMVGAGALVELLLGIPYEISVVMVGVLVIIYVTVGGMLATTWVQIIKAILLLMGAALMCIIVLWLVNFDINSVFAKAVENHPRGDKIMHPGSLFSDPIQAITIGVSMMFGTLGLPHVLMRLFTVEDMQAAKKSVFYASGIMGVFYVMVLLIGFASIIYVTGNAEYTTDGKLIGGSNMAAIHLSHALGGNVLMGFMSAVAFSTILAVVAGLTVAGAAAVAHDIYSQHICDGNADPKKELLISRITVLVLCSLAVFLGILFKNQNVAFIAVMPMVISASVNFPILVMAMYWRRLSTRGALVGGLVGFVSSIGLIVTGPKVWVSIVGAQAPLFPYDYPGLFSMTAAFVTMVLVSLLDHSASAKQDRQMFDDQLVAAELGIDVAAPVDH